MNPRVSIICTSYCPESKPYLNLCIESIRGLTYDNFETIIVGRPDHWPQYEGTRTISPPYQDFWNSTGLNYGVKYSDPESEYYFLINDDVILTKNCIQGLLSALQDSKVGQVMPIGNDMQGRYDFPMLPPGIKLKDIPKDQLNQIMVLDSPYPKGIIFADTLCLYAQMISKKVWNEVGPFDETLTGQDDIDYSLRVRQKGYINAIELSSLVWHFGGVSADITLTPEKRRIAQETFNKKWEHAIQK